MKTLDLNEAAEFLKMAPEGLRTKAANGDIPGAKPGKRWCFREDDLAEYLRSLYPGAAKELQGVIENSRSKTWHSTKEIKSIGLISTTVVREYNEVLGLATN